MRLREFTNPKDYFLPDAEAAELPKENQGRLALENAESRLSQKPDAEPKLYDRL
jgi:hypothetical protein